MRSPWVNIALLFLLLMQAATGYFGFTSGHEPEAWILWLHGVGAYALILLMFWKSGVIFDAWRRKRRWTGKRVGFAAALVLLVLTLAAGLIWTFVGPVYLGGFSLVSLHIYLAVPLMAMILWHAWHMRFIRRTPGAVDRRLFLRTTAASLGGLLAWLTVGRLKAWQELPGDSRRFTGSYETGSYSALFPSVSWIADRPPPVSLDRWWLVVEGAVERPLSFSYESLSALPPATLTAALDCTGGWYTEQQWQGVRVADLLAMAGVGPGASSVTFEATSGYKRRFSLAEAEGFLLATGLWVGARETEGGVLTPLTHGHGFPLRLVAPGRRGVEWVKWVSRVRVNTTGPLWQLPLPLQ